MYDKIYDVITVGSATIDVFAETETDVVTVDHPNNPSEKLLVYPVGSKILIGKMNTFTGGGGTNTAVSFARQGYKTAFIGKLGNDENANIILKELASEHIDFLGSYHRTKNTGYSIILDTTKAHDRTVLTYKGSNNDLKWSELKREGLQANWFYFSSMIDQSYRTLELIARHAKKQNSLIAFNPSTYLVKLGRKYLARLFSMVNVLILNKEEAQILAEESTEDINILLKELRKLGPDIIVITDGPNGAYCYGGHERYFVRPKKIKVIETTGAGDAFASTFIGAYMIKQDISYALQLAQLNSESVIKRFGAKNKLLTKEELIRQHKFRKPRVSKTKI